MQLSCWTPIHERLAGDWYLERTVPAQDIEIMWGEHGWRPLTAMDVRGLAGGEWDDDEVEDGADEDDPDADVYAMSIRDRRRELIRLATMAHPDKSPTEIRQRIKEINGTDLIGHLIQYRRKIG